MNLFETLTDITNFDWKLHSRDGSYLWVEDDHSLDVIVTPLKNDKEFCLSVRHKNGGPEIKLRQNQLENYLLIAIDYAQLADGDHGWPEGTVGNFWQLAEAIAVLGAEPNFGKTKEGIYAHVGDAQVFCEYRDGRYDLFDSGIHSYAATISGLKRAYNKLKKELDLWTALETGTKTEKSFT